RPPSPQDRRALHGRQGPAAAGEGREGRSFRRAPGDRQVRPAERERRRVRLLRRRVLIIPSGRPSSCGTARRPLSPAFPRPTALPCRPVSPPSGPPVSPLEVTVLAIVCPGQGAQKPGFLSPWRELPGVEQSLSALSDAAGLD